MSIFEDLRSSRVHTWLSPPDPSVTFRRKLEETHHSSGQWFLQGAEYIRWKSNRNSFLWLHGMPGSGKTVLSSVIIEDLKNGAMTGQTPLYFFFTFTNTSMQSLDNMIRSLICQLYHEHPSSQKHVEALYSSCQDGRQQPSTRSLCTTFQNMTNDVAETWIVLDALDECNTLLGTPSTGLLEWIKSLFKYGKSNIHLLATSRPEPDIQSALDSAERVTHPTPPAASLSGSVPPAHTAAKEEQPAEEPAMEPPERASIEGKRVQHISSASPTVTEDANVEIPQEMGKDEWAPAGKKKGKKSKKKKKSSSIPPVFDEPTTVVQEPTVPLDTAIPILKERSHVAEQATPISKETMPITADTQNDVHLTKEPITFGGSDIPTSLELHDQEPSYKIPIYSGGYGTRSRNRLNVARPDYVEDMEMDFEIPAANRSSGSSSERTTPSPAVGTDAGQSTAANDIKSVSTMGGWAHSQVSIPINNLMQADIRAYVHYKVREPQNGFRRWDRHPHVLDMIETTVIGNSNGMFRWVAVQLDTLENCLDLPSLRAALGSLPQSLDETYTRILHGIPQGYKRHTIRILQFLTFSTRPLRAEEAIDALAVDLDGIPQFDKQNRMQSLRELTRYCSSLVYLDTREGEIQVGNLPVVEIQLAHFSVKEFLVSNRLKGEFANHFEEKPAKTSVAKTCLAYLLQLRRKHSVQEMMRSLPLSAYASQLWMNLACGAESDDSLHTLVSELFMQPYAYHNWLCLYTPDRPWHGGNVGDIDSVPSPFYYACLGDLRRSVREMLLSKDLDINRQEGFFGTALQAAVQAGNEEIVRMLLQHGCEVNQTGGLYGNAVQAAAQGGHYEIVDLLLRFGADPNAKGGIFGIPIQAAAEGGYLEIVELLLRNGAKVNITDEGLYGSAIQAAAQSGSSAIVELLLNHGADVNTSSGLLGSALQAAALRGNVYIVHTLLQNGADVNQKCGMYRTALQAAARGGHTNIVDTLVRHGADVHAIGGLFGTALQAAAQGGHSDVVTLLLDAKADPDAQGGRYGNAITAASMCGHEETSRAHMKHKANSAMWQSSEPLSTRSIGQELTTFSTSDSTTLCLNCRIFDFAVMFADVPRGFLNMGLVQEISSRPRCSLCCVVTSVLNNYTISRKHSVSGDWLERSVCKLYPHPNKPLLSIICGGALRGHISIIQHSNNSIERSASNGGSRASEKFDFRFDRVQKPLELFGGMDSELNVHQVRSWFNVCETQHDDCNDAIVRNKSYNPFGLLLVDVMDLCLVDANSGYRYVALSYVRGGADMIETRRNNEIHRKEPQALSENKLRERGESLPQIVKDAMDFTRKVGQRFLWIDVLCIVQDGQNKIEQIMRMDAIYSQAWLTLASVSGATAHEGLPGISQNCRSPPRACKTVNGLDIYLHGRDYGTNMDIIQMHTTQLHLMTEPPGLDLQVDALPYETRAWTFQERLLSKRCIYLTKHQAYFHCRSACVSEIEDAIGIPENSSHAFDHIFRNEYEATPAKLLEIRGQSFNKSRFLQYASLVEQYARRQMTSADDILNAFSGLSAVLRHNWATKFTCGIPSSFFHEALLWFPSSANFSRRSTSKQAFPTWSWAAWQGGVQYFSADPRYSSRVCDPVAFSINNQVSVGPDDFSANDFLHSGDPDQASSILNQPNAAVRLYFTTLAVPARCFEFMDSDRDMRIMDREGRFCGIIPFMTSQMVAKLKGELDPCEHPLARCDFVEISRLEPQFERANIQVSSTKTIDAFDPTEFEAIAGKWTIVNVLLILWDTRKRCAERIALGLLHEQAWHSNLVTKEIKEVVLS